MTGRRHPSVAGADNQALSRNSMRRVEPSSPCNAVKRRTKAASRTKRLRRRTVKAAANAKHTLAAPSSRPTANIAANDAVHRQALVRGRRSNQNVPRTLCNSDFANRGRGSRFSAAGRAFGGIAIVAAALREADEIAGGRGGALGLPRTFVSAPSRGIRLHLLFGDSSSRSFSAGRSSRKLQRGQGLAAAADKQNTTANPVVAANPPAASCNRTTNQ
jgi:hypothetical protein